MENPHCGAIRTMVTAENYSAPVRLRSGVDGTVVNDGVARYRNLSNQHLSPVDEGRANGELFLHVETNQSRVQIVMCMKHELYDEQTRTDIKVSREMDTEPGLITETLSYDAEIGKTVTMEKLVSFATSRDENTASPVDTAQAMLSRFTNFGDLFARHKERWHVLWNDADMIIEGDELAQQVVRLHIYHLLCTASPHNAHIDAGMPARGLHGEAYRGHVFWDSLFVMPFFYQRFPEIARSGLMYRYRRLDAARNYAREYGYEGAMYPWQSADEGKEETQIIHFNPVSGKWDPDLSSRQRHVNIAIFYNIWEYYHYSGDARFLHEYGAEMLLEIARFWASIAEYDESDGRYHIRGVMGPDEFHEKYPEAPAQQGGFNDNAYTNIMTVWVMEHALWLIDHLPEQVMEALAAHLNFDRSEAELWRKISRTMYVPITKDGLIEQFEGYMKLQDLDLDYYRAKYGNIHRMDRILKSHGDSPDKYKVAKQADTLMLFYVLSPDEVIHILAQLGYPVVDKEKFLQKNYEYYSVRTSHGSTLSKVVHASISREMSSKEDMWQWFQEALESDIYDTQGGTTIEGIHCGVMAGTLNIISRVFAGVTFFEQAINIRPVLPAKWKRLYFKLLLNGTKYSFEVTHQEAIVGVDIEGDNPLYVRVAKNG
jgi:trehalose/maltose hydrolase-like predicted phosphorylase